MATKKKSRTKDVSPLSLSRTRIASALMESGNSFTFIAPAHYSLLGFKFGMINFPEQIDIHCEDDLVEFSVDIIQPTLGLPPRVTSQDTTAEFCVLMTADTDPMYRIDLTHGRVFFVTELADLDDVNTQLFCFLVHISAKREQVLENALQRAVNAAKEPDLYL